jgi:ABC-type Na+ efflux pump permease subunit
VLLAVLGLSAFALRNQVSLGSGLYRIGVSADAPVIRDSRFSTIAVDAAQGEALLNRHAIDAMIDGTHVIHRDDNQSLYAVQALKQYLEQEELARIGAAYPPDQAFPLRVGINYLGPAEANGQTAAGSEAPLVGTEEIIIPSLNPPPVPFTQVILALLYILPITFISIFFTSSFMDEKVNRRLTLLLSAPITPFQIILGKMLPYACFALITTVLIGLLTHANLPLVLLIYIPTTLFIFAIYLMVPLFYRTFKDITFIAMLVTVLTTAYLVFPAMFTNVSELAFISPLTLAVKMYRGESFGWREYLFPSVPMTALFGIALFAGSRMLNEEFLMGYRSITRKLADAIYLTMAHIRPYFAVPLWSLLAIPAVYLVQLIFLAFATNLPVGMIFRVVLLASAAVEEVAKSVGIVVLADHGLVKTTRSVLTLAFLSALGFLIGEKLLLLVSISAVSQGPIPGVVFGASGLLLVTLFAHFAFTAIVTFLTTKGKFPYILALAVGTLIHFIYNAILIGGL